MPGPGKKSKPKAKSSTTPSARSGASEAFATPDAYVGDIDHAATWHLIVNILCDVFEIPGELRLSNH